jgi:hypothetical protein
VYDGSGESVLRQPSLARRLRLLPHGTRVELVWVDASGCQEEDGAPGELGGLQLLKSLGYISGVDGEKVVCVRNISLMDGTHRDSESVALDNVVRFEVLAVGERVEAKRWLRRKWIAEVLAGRVSE